MCARAGLEVFEYAPARVKRAVAGRGRADKAQVAQMVRVVLGLAGAPPPTRPTRSLAVTHLQRSPFARAAATYRATQGHAIIRGVPVRRTARGTPAERELSDAPPHLSTSVIAAAAVVCCASLYAAAGAGARRLPRPQPRKRAAGRRRRTPTRPCTSVQAFYDKSTTFKSDFQQKFWVKAYNHEKTSSGHVTFAKPGKMEWVYDDPKDNRVVSDGTTIRVYEASNKQMYEQPVDKIAVPGGALVPHRHGQAERLLRLPALRRAPT